MRIPDSCAKCLYNRQENKTNNAEYLRRVKELLDNRSETDTSPYMVYKFARIYEEMFGSQADYSDIKRRYNDFVIAIEDEIRNKIEMAEDPLAESLKYARIGNYIDFGAMNSVDENVLITLLEEAKLSDNDEKVYREFVSQCKKSKKFLLICDNCGEIVLDRLFLEQFVKRFPDIEVSVLVRGAEVLNDATRDDAVYAGIDKLAKVYDNGLPVAGTMYDMLPEATKAVFDTSDVILAKGQGNYESISGNGHHVFYAFLCKCDLFITRFNVPMLTGMFVEEK